MCYPSASGAFLPTAESRRTLLLRYSRPIKRCNKAARYLHRAARKAALVRHEAFRARPMRPQTLCEDVSPKSRRGSIFAGTLDSPRMLAQHSVCCTCQVAWVICPGFAGTGGPTMWSEQRAAGADKVSADSHLVRRMTPPGTRR